MSSSTNLVSGLSSGFDWSTMVTQLIAIDHRRVDNVSTQKTSSENKLAEWQDFNTKLLALKTVAGNLSNNEAFSLFKSSLTTDSSTVKAADLLSVTASETAAVGAYTLKVNNLATAQKLSSGAFAVMDEALGAGSSGDILINGSLISITSTDTLVDVRDKINNANAGTSATGVTASVINYGAGDYRLLLTSEDTGTKGIDLRNGGAVDMLGNFGFTDSSRAARNHLAGGDQSGRFNSTNVAIKSLLGLTTAQTAAEGDIVINGHEVGAIDLNADTLGTLQTKLAAAGLAAAITSETEDNQTYYRLMIQGSGNTYADKNNILETLGFIAGGFSDVYGVSGDVANTSGGAAITSATLIKDIDGFTGYESTDYIHLGGTDTGGTPVTDDTFTLSDTSTVQDLLDKIETLFGDVTASITGAGKLSVVSNVPGASPLAIQIAVKNSGGTTDETLAFDIDGDMGAAASVRKRQIVAGADASVTVDGVTVARSENTIDDLITGVTLELLKADTGVTVSLAIGRDTDAIMAKINAFVASYNSVATYIATQTSYDATEAETGGILFGDGTLMSIKTDLTATLLQNVWGVAADYSTMGLIGINVDSAGQLSVNNTVLQGYLKTNWHDVRKLFAVDGTTDAGAVEYVTYGEDTKEGEYTVNIATAATRSTSAASDNTVLSGDEILTIIQGDYAATVNLTSSMSMTQMVNAINSELNTVYTQVLAGNEELYADPGATAKITAATNWEDIYASVGSSAGLTDGDVISFSGKTHSGADINGSYTIDDAATDTVQGLLSAIETAYANQVTAAINSSGQLIVTDKTAGNSSLAFSFTSQPHDLDFGSLLATNPGGQTGRYAINITATADTGNHLILTHNSYGAGHSFTIHQKNNLLWTDGDQTVNNGVDVAGTINGEAATGVGQTLTGNSDAANIAGLVVKYTGAATGNAGAVKLTLGIGELFNRTLFTITDARQGYVSYKQESLKNSIADYETQIDQMEARLALKQEQMLNRFKIMELALQKLQTQSSWLSSQLNALTGS